MYNPFGSKYYWVLGYRNEERKVYGPYASRDGAQSTAENMTNAEVFESSEKDRYQAIQDIKLQMSRRKPTKLNREVNNPEPDGMSDNFSEAF